MSIKLQLPKLTDLRPRITVIGVGGAGGNALNNMIASGLHGVEFVAANTDAQALAMTAAEHRIQLGVTLTEGLGAGSKPEIGQAAAEEAADEIRQQLSGSHMCFIAAGMGGGTGTGAAAVIAALAKGLGVLTVGVVTKPFQFEGQRRMRMAEAGIVELRKHVDTLIVIPNQNLFRIATERTTFADAFLLADQVLHSGVACIVDLIVREGLINLDFADVRTVMANMGNAMMGTGEGSGERRAIQAAEAAIHNPLIDDISLKGAKGLLLSVTGGRDLTLYEVDEAASRVRQEVDPDANIIVGATFDETLTDKVRVSIVASGIARIGEPSQPVPAPQLRPFTREQQAHAGRAQAIAAPGPASDDSLRHRLASALRPGTAAPVDDEVPLDLAEDIAPEAQPDTSAPVAKSAPEPWIGPGDVRIVEQMPRLGSAPQYDGSTGSGSGHPASHGHSQLPVHPAAGVAQFQPAPPVQPRGPTRRMPEVADFPAVGQREYHAKTQPPAPGLEPHGTSAQPADQPAARRPGILERLSSSFQRRPAESAVPQGGSDSDYDIGVTAAGVAAPSYGAAYDNRQPPAQAQVAEPPRPGAPPRLKGLR